MTNFDTLLSQIKTQKVFIQTHNFPDPDAIASAFGLSKLLEARGIDSKIIYSGLIDRANTQNMIGLLGIELHHLSDTNEIRPDDTVIFVDCQPNNSNVKTCITNSVLCIDHHPFSGNNTYCYKDIRTTTGACSSIIAQYFFQNKEHIDPRVATALLYGIKVDTANFTRKVSPLDLEMFYKLYPFSESDSLHAIEHNTLNIEDLNAYSRAIDTIKITDNLSFAKASANCPEALIATISDFMLDLTDIHVSVVHSVKEKGIKISVRSDDAALDSGVICSEALCGIGDGGGHSTMAGGFVPFSKKMDVDTLVNTIEESFIKVYQNLQNATNNKN